MDYARQPGDGFFDVGTFTQRVVPLAGDHRAASDELLYVLDGAGTVRIDGEEHAVHAGCAVYAPRDTAWSAIGDAQALSVLVHDCEAGGEAAVVDLGAVEKGAATAGRQFVLGPRCPGATQFIGLIPPGRAPE